MEDVQRSARDGLLAAQRDLLVALQHATESPALAVNADQARAKVESARSHLDHAEHALAQLVAVEPEAESEIEETHPLPADEDIPA